MDERFELLLFIDDFHGPTTQDIGGPHEYRIANLGSCFQGFGCAGSGGILGLAQAQFHEQSLETLAILSLVDAVRSGAYDGCSSLSQRYREVQGCLAAELDNDTVWGFALNDVQYVFHGQGLKVEFVGSVIIGTHRLWIGINHD